MKQALAKRGTTVDSLFVLHDTNMDKSVGLTDGFLPGQLSESLHHVVHKSPSQRLAIDAETPSVKCLKLGFQMTCTGKCSGKWLEQNMFN
eukprot:5600698-Amphidinium_carterae.1